MAHGVSLVSEMTLEKAPKTQKKCIRGFVTSDKMDKSRVMAVVRKVKHPVIGKYIKKTTKYMYHDEKNMSKMGDEVVIVPTKPISARKSFVLQEVVGLAKE